MKVGDIVTLRRASDEAISASMGRLVRYVGHAAIVLTISHNPDGAEFIAIGFRDQFEVWVSRDMLQ